jgi:hypothetical protein
MSIINTTVGRLLAPKPSLSAVQRERLRAWLKVAYGQEFDNRVYDTQFLMLNELVAVERGIQ